MKGQRIGYIRVSTTDQNPVRQLDGVELDKTFTDFASGKDTSRPELQEMLRYVREGDMVIVHSMDRLGRDVIDLVQLVRRLTGQGIAVRFHKENLTYSGDDSPMDRLFLTMMGAFAEFDRAHNRERQREGIAAAKKRGVYKGREKALSPEQANEMRRRAAAGEQKAPLARAFNISRATLYQYLATATPNDPPDVNQCGEH